MKNISQNRKVYVTIFLMIIVFSLIVIANLRSQEYDGIRINLSGRQRMLSQKMTKEILQYTIGITDKEQIMSTVKVFDDTLTALQFGGNAPLDLLMSESLSIPPMEDRLTWNQLEKTRKLWMQLKEKIEYYLEIKDDFSLNYIIENNTPVLNEMDSAVIMMQYNAEKKVKSLYLILLLAVLVSFFLLIFSLTIEKLKKQVKKIEEINRLKSIFIASLNHELRTPLNSIIGFTGLILQGISGKIDEDAKKDLEIVYKSSKHLLKLINDVMDISKIEAGKFEIHYEDVKIDLLVGEVITTVSREAEEKKLNIVTEVPEGLIVLSDSRRLFQCLLNLMSNAVRFTEQGDIFLNIEQLKDLLRISVTDTGIGIKKEDLSKLFKSFSRLETPMKEATSGAGLGLYLTQKIVDIVFHGIIKVESEYGRGSTFILEIPLISDMEEGVV